MGRGLEQLPQYQCHKKVRAAKIGAIQSPCDHGSQTLDLIEVTVKKRTNGKVTTLSDLPAVTMDAAWMAKHKPEVGGYLVVYEDGYNSYSPAKAFEDGYTRI